jgi:hypothetical protein
MRTPGFSAEFSLYVGNQTYRRKSGNTPDTVGQTVSPQKITCSEYECGSWGQIPIWCVRCDSDRLM